MPAILSTRILAQMDDSTTSQVAALNPQNPAESLQRYNAWFTDSPEPWDEIARLEYGGDRTFASTVERFVMSAEPAQWPVVEEKLLAALARPELTEAGRLFICKMLRLVGSSRCIEPVARWLSDARNSHAARIALDALDDPAVDAAYRAALPTLHGDSKAGLIGSIAFRGDREALPAIKAIAEDSNESAVVRTVAQRAVERLEAKS